jgi:2-keto-myo-inositol isomerase
LRPAFAPVPQQDAATVMGGGAMRKALNHMTTPDLGYEAFLDLAKSLDCTGVEVRNDIARPLFDGMEPSEAGRIARAKGLRLLGLSQVYPFNNWSEALAQEVGDLIAIAKAAGAETISLIPRNDGTGTAAGERQANLRRALAEVLPMLDAADMVALVEPLGFPSSSLRQKSELVEAIEALGARDRFKLVHDTFHHALAGGGPIFPEYTGIVHISGVVDPVVPVEQMQDAHRVLVDAHDRLGNVAQIAALLAAGYDGAFSYECFAPETHALADPHAALKRSFDFIAERLAEMAG